MTRRLVAALVAVVLALVAPGPAATAAGPNLNAKAWVLVDGRDGEVLAARSRDRALPIASTTKMMTAYVAVQKLPLRKIVRAAPYEAMLGESLLGLRPNQRISVRDLLYGLIMRSGNDAAHALAIAASGSTEAFVAEMNRRAAALGLTNTHFANPVGLDEAGNYSTAYDLAALGRRLLAVPVLAKIANSRTAVLASMRPPVQIETRIDLLNEVPWATGIKTGYTLGAGYVLVGSGSRDGTELVSAVLGTTSEYERDLQSRRLLDYGFSLYERRVPVRVGEVLATPSIRYSGGELELRAGRKVAVGLRPGQRLQVSVEAPDEVEGPLRRGATLGRAMVLVDGQKIATVPLLSVRAVPKAGTLDRVRSYLGDNLVWLILVLSAILIGAVLMRRLKR